MQSFVKTITSESEQCAEKPYPKVGGNRQTEAVEERHCNGAD